MRRATAIVLISTAVLLALSAAAADQSFASGRLLTFYANGEAVALGSPFETGFELKTADPVMVSIPATGLSLSCAAEAEFAIFGWFDSNGLKTDVIGSNGYNTGPVRECSGHEFGGLLFDGTLHIRSNGQVVDGENEYLDYLPQLEIDGCYYFGKLKGKISLPGPFTTTLSGAMKSHHAECPPVADVEVGPLDGFYDSHLVEGRISR
jgi:hypothetical protein